MNALLRESFNDALSALVVVAVMLYDIALVFLCGSGAGYILGRWVGQRNAYSQGRIDQCDELLAKIDEIRAQRGE